MDSKPELRFDLHVKIHHDGKLYNFKELIDYYKTKYDKFNHKTYRGIVNKVRRKFMRQLNGKLRDKLIEKYEAIREESPTYQQYKYENEIRIERELKEDLERREREHALWLERERVSQTEFQAKKEKEEKIEQKRRFEQTDEFDQIRKLSSEGNPTHNPIVSYNHPKPQDKCKFFTKIGICKYGLRCDKIHDSYLTTNTLLFKGMLSDFVSCWSSKLKEDYECDATLEHEEVDVYETFRRYYYDLLSEFKRFGHVVQLKVCCNYQDYLRGNVYVQYEREEDAVKAFDKFNGRYYANKQVFCQYTRVSSWREAICGLFLQKKCPNIHTCNYLHVFKDPDGQFRQSNYDTMRKSSFSDEYQISYDRNKRWSSSSPELETPRHNKHKKRKRSKSSESDKKRQRKEKEKYRKKRKHNKA